MCCGARAFPHRQIARRSRPEDSSLRSFRPARERATPPAACTDIDTAEFRPPKPERAAQLRGPTQRHAHATLRGKRIATVRHMGIATAAGCQLVATCDLAVASD